MTYLIYADGACSGNGYASAKGSGSFAVYVLGNSEAIPVNEELHLALQRKPPIHHEARFTVKSHAGGRLTNNMAEAATMASAITWALNNGLLTQGNHVHLCMDSQLVLSQLLGSCRCKNRVLRNIYERVYAMLEKQSERVGVNVETLISLHKISGDTMKASVIGH